MRLTRSRAAWLCLTAGALLLIAAIPVTWIGVRIRSADRYTDTVAPLANEPAIQAQVATAVGTNVASRVDVTGIVDRVAPGRSAQLQDVIQPLVQAQAEQVAFDVVQSDRFAALWADVNRGVHEQLMDALEGDSDGPVSLDLSPVVREVEARLNARGIPTPKRDLLAPSIVVLDADQAGQARQAVKLLNRLSWAVPLLALAFLGASLWLAPDRWRGLARLGAAIAVAAAITAVALAIGRRFLISSAVDAGSTEDAAAAFFRVLTDDLRAGLRVLLAVGALVLLVGLIAPAPRRAAIARFIAANQVVARIACALPVLAVLLLVDAPSAVGVLLALAVSAVLYLGVRGLGRRAAA
jgi:hypothetical protein